VKRKIKVGVIGAGRIGKIHTENIIRYVPQAEIAAVADIYVDRIKDWANDFGIEKLTTDYMEILNDDEIEIVIICSPTDTHSKIIIESAEVGKHIFCEKPIDLDLGKIRQTIKSIDKSGVKFQIGFNRRFDHNFKKIKELIKNGSAGNIYLVKITSWDPEVPPIEYVKVSGGLFLDMAIHDFDMARFLTDSEAKEVYAVGDVFINPAVKDAGDIDTAIVTLRLENGAMVVIDNCRKAPHGYDQRVEVLGSKGFVFTSNDTETTAALGTESGIHSEKPFYFFTQRYKDSYINEILTFFDAVINNKNTPVGAVDGLRPVIMGMAAIKSLKENRPVKIEEVENADL